MVPSMGYTGCGLESGHTKRLDQGRDIWPVEKHACQPQRLARNRNELALVFRSQSIEKRCLYMWGVARGMQGGRHDYRLENQPPAAEEVRFTKQGFIQNGLYMIGALKIKGPAFRYGKQALGE